MSKIIVTVNSTDISKLAWTLSERIDELSTTEITYDIYTNKYTYGNTGISLYSTDDILEYYFNNVIHLDTTFHFLHNTIPQSVLYIYHQKQQKENLNFVNVFRK